MPPSLTRRRALALPLCLPLTKARAGERGPAGHTRVLRLATGTDETSPDGQWLRHVYRLALGRLGLSFEAVFLPAKRAELLVLAGELDGEMVRASEYLDLNPQLVRVPFVLMVDVVGVYGAPSSSTPHSTIAAVRAATSVVHRRGVVACERRVRQWVGPERIAVESTTRSAVMAVVRGQYQYLCELDSAASVTLEDLEKHGVPRLQRIGALPPSVELFPVLHARHHQIAAELAQAMKSLEAEGLMASGEQFRGAKPVR